MMGLVRFLGTFLVGVIVGDTWAHHRMRPALARSLTAGDVRMRNVRRGVPGPIEVLHGFMLRDRQPPPAVVRYAIAEAELMGRHDLIRHLVRTFVQPANASVQVYETAAPSAPMTQAQAQAQAPSPAPPEPQKDDETSSDSSANDGDVDDTTSVNPSPLPGVADDQWAAFSGALAREAPTFDSNRHVGRYRHRKDRLRELGCDPEIVRGNPHAQDVALAMDVVDAARHLHESGTAAQHVGRTVLLPGEPEPRKVTLSGVVGLAHAAGLEECVSWLESHEDRKRYPHTTKIFATTNGVF